MKKYLAALPLLVLLGCATRQPHIKAIQFRDCAITERRDGHIKCECQNIEWIKNVNNQWIAVCINTQPQKAHPVEPSWKRQEGADEDVFETGF